MQARDAAGRQVSLLNDDITHRLAYRTQSSYREESSSPVQRTPELLRSNSYDSNASYDTISPLTPSLYDCPLRPLYDDYSADKSGAVLKRPAYVDSRSSSYEDEASNSASMTERTGKRYPCRYRESHGCEKTFTTSGHASRHSKIHTAEKAVQCTYPGCQKKFTRADNMKQHLETHYKEKSRSSSSSKSSSRSMGSSTAAKRASLSRSSTTRSGVASPDVTMWDAEQCPLPFPSAAWDMGGLALPAYNRPNPLRAHSGLDALAAIACQEGSA